MSLILLFHYLLINMFRMLVHPSSGACDILWIYFMYNAPVYRLAFCHYVLLLLLLLRLLLLTPQSSDWLATFQMDLLQDTLFIAV
jgi:hypothetical protein